MKLVYEHPSRVHGGNRHGNSHRRGSYRRGGEGTAGELAALVQCHFAEVDAFNASPPGDSEYFLGDQPFDPTLTELIGVPARSAPQAF